MSTNSSTTRVLCSFFCSFLRRGALWDRCLYEVFLYESPGDFKALFWQSERELECNSWWCHILYVLLLQGIDLFVQRVQHWSHQWREGESCLYSPAFHDVLSDHWGVSRMYCFLWGLWVPLALEDSFLLSSLYHCAAPVQYEGLCLFGFLSEGYVWLIHSL